MTLDEYIAKLQDLKKQYGGEIRLVDIYDHEVEDPEHVKGAIVICSKV